MEKTLNFLTFASGLLVFLRFFSEAFLCGKNILTFASGLSVFLTFTVTFKKPFCMEKMF